MACLPTYKGIRYNSIKEIETLLNSIKSQYKNENINNNTDQSDADLDYDRIFAEKLFNNYKKDFVPADKNKVYELIEISKNEGIKGVLKHIIANTKDPILKVFAEAFLNNIDRADFLQIKFDLARNKYGESVPDAGGSYGGGIININWRQVFFKATNLVHKNGLDSGYKTIIHELVHVYTLQALRNPKTEKEKAFKKEITSAYKTLKQDSAFKDVYGLTSVEEFISEIIANPEFRGILNVYKPGTAAKIVNYIAKLFGYVKDVNMEESSRADLIHNTVNTFLNSLPYLTPSKGKDIFYDKTSNIKAGVEELFDSNPELANSVYEALGFKQTITQDNKSYYRGQIDTPIIDKDGNLILYGKEDELYKRAGLKSKGVSMTDDLQSAIEYGNGQLEVAQNLASESYDAEQELQKLSDNGYYLIQIPKDVSNKIVNEAGEVKVIGDKIVIPKGQYKIEQIVEGEEQQITPQQKQQALQLYSQYLDTIFPDSKVKDIVYRGKTENQTNQKSKKLGIFFTDDKNAANIYAIKYKDDEFDDSIIQGIVNKFGLNPTIEQIKSEIAFFKNMGATKEQIEKNAKEFQNYILNNKGLVQQAILNIRNPKNLTVKDWFDNYENSYKLKSNSDSLLLKGGKQSDNRIYDAGENQIVVFEPEQIHILSSKKDLKMFRNFINFTKSEYAKYGDIQQFRDYVMSKNFAAIEEFLVVNNKIDRKC